MALMPPRLGRPLAAIGLSLALHGALLVLVNVAPPGVAGGASIIEARLVPRVSVAEIVTPEDMPATEPDDATDPTSLVPVETAEAVPVTPADVVEPQPPAAAPMTEAAPDALQDAPALAISSGVDLNYYPSRELDVQPRARHAILPDYPPDADRQRLSGTVRLQVKLEADGRIGDVSVVSADPPGAFDDSALSAFRAARFAPGRKDGRPVRALLLIEVRYDWEGSGGR